MILCYHDVDPEWRSPLAVTPAEFRRQCEWLAEHRRVVPLSELVEDLDRRMLPPRGTVALTFDDGFRGVHEHALEVLVEHRLPATFFIVSDTLRPGGRPVDWVDGEEPGARRTMSRSQVEELAAAGMDVQSHTATHPDLTATDEEATVDELTRSRGDLEDLLGRPVEHVAYPRGRHDRRVRAATTAAGYAWAYSLPEQRETTGPMAVPRVGVFPGNGPRTLAVKARPSYLRFRHSRVFPWVRSVVRRAYAR